MKMSKPEMGLVFVLLSCLNGIAQADVTYTLVPFVGLRSTLTGSITVDHTGTLTASDVVAVSFTSTSSASGPGFSFSGPFSAFGGGGDLVLIATPTSLSFDPIAAPGGTRLGMAQHVNGDTAQVTFSTQLVSDFFMIPAQVSWGTSTQVGTTINPDGVSFASSGLAVIGTASPVPEPSSFAQMGIALTAGCGVAGIRTRRRRLTAQLSGT